MCNSRGLSDHVHIEETIKKGNRLIAYRYITSIIENFDDFNRVYYGDILWKTIALPSINYACAIWVDSSKQDTDKIESIQLQMAKSAFRRKKYLITTGCYSSKNTNLYGAMQNAFPYSYINTNMAVYLYSK